MMVFELHNARKYCLGSGVAPQPPIPLYPPKYNTRTFFATMPPKPNQIIAHVTEMRIQPLASLQVSSVHCSAVVATLRVLGVRSCHTPAAVLIGVVAKYPKQGSNFQKGGKLSTQGANCLKRANHHTSCKKSEHQLVKCLKRGQIVRKNGKISESLPQKTPQ